MIQYWSSRSSTVCFWMTEQESDLVLYHRFLYKKPESCYTDSRNRQKPERNADMHMFNLKVNYSKSAMCDSLRERHNTFVRLYRTKIL